MASQVPLFLSPEIVSTAGIEFLFSDDLVIKILIATLRQFVDILKDERLQFNLLTQGIVPELNTLLGGYGHKNEKLYDSSTAELYADRLFQLMLENPDYKLIHEDGSIDIDFQEECASIHYFIEVYCSRVDDSIRYDTSSKLLQCLEEPAKSSVIKFKSSYYGRICEPSFADFLDCFLLHVDGEKLAHGTKYTQALQKFAKTDRKVRSRLRGFLCLKNYGSYLYVRAMKLLREQTPTVITALDTLLKEHLNILPDGLEYSRKMVIKYFLAQKIDIYFFQFIEPHVDTSRW